ncbi:hypothetical protein [Niveibacterium sp. SC-1]|uniref:hypothetical protein n=1 Tax=Niveibacterium sp. SC-1 TaxID=3135646 RepID=UPI00311D5A94
MHIPSSALRLPVLAAALLGLAACATGEAPKPAAEAKPAAPAGNAKPLLTGFASATATEAGADVVDIVYSEKKDDAALTSKDFAGGVLTVNGQVGTGKGSQWAGVGVSMNVAKGEMPKIDASGYTSVTFRLASPTTGSLRLRIMGDEQAVRNAGCYPIFVQPVTDKLTEYTIKLEAFQPEGWCGAQARRVAQTLPVFGGFEIVDVAMLKKPTRFSVGSITLNP